MLSSKRKEMNTCNFWVIRIAQQPIPASPISEKNWAYDLHVSFYLVNIEIHTLSWDGERPGILPPSATPTWEWSGSLEGLLSSSVVSCRRDCKMLSQVLKVQGKVTRPSQACFSSPVIQIRETLAYTTEAPPAVLAYRKHLL